MKQIKDPIDNILGRIIGFAVRAWKIRMDQKLAETGIELRLEHIVLLRTIYENEGVNQQEITFHMFRDKTAITRWIDHLEKMNLVLRVPDKLDRRKKLVYLTNEAKELFPKILIIATETEKEAVEGLSVNDVNICKEILRKVRQNLEGVI